MQTRQQIGVVGLWPYHFRKKRQNREKPQGRIELGTSRGNSLRAGYWTNAPTWYHCGRTNYYKAFFFAGVGFTDCALDVLFFWDTISCFATLPACFVAADVRHLGFILTESAIVAAKEGMKNGRWKCTTPATSPIVEPFATTLPVRKRTNTFKSVCASPPGFGGRKSGLQTNPRDLLDPTLVNKGRLRQKKWFRPKKKEF